MKKILLLLCVALGAQKFSNCATTLSKSGEARSESKAQARKLPFGKFASMGAKMSGGLGGLGGLAGKAGGRSGSVRITPPPKPQEILPPKPIIIAPIFVRPGRMKRKMKVIHTGSAFPPTGFPFGMMPGFPSNSGRGSRSLRRSALEAQNAALVQQNQLLYQAAASRVSPQDDPSYAYSRKLANGQQINFFETSVDVPGLRDGFKMSETTKTDAEGKQSTSTKVSATPEAADRAKREKKLVQTYLADDLRERSLYLRNNFDKLSANIKRLDDNMQKLKSDENDINAKISEFVSKAQMHFVKPN